MKKINYCHFSGLCFMLFLLASVTVKAQISSNTVKYQITYNPVSQVYTAWVVPDYNVPNANNLGATEFGGTAQFSIVVPKDFVITNITDIRGTWTKTTDSDFRKLGPGQPGQTWVGLDPTLNYYLIGKAPNETNYGIFAVGVPVSLFSFTGNSCYGVVKALPANDPFITAADLNYSLNAGNSFYSRSGQPSGGNQKPLEQFLATTGIPANCLPPIANPDTASTAAGISKTIIVLANDKANNGTQATLTNVTTPIITALPTKGTAIVNLDGTIKYTPNLGTFGTDIFIYTICDKINTITCDTAKVTIFITGVPQANLDIASVVAGVSSTIPILVNDRNPDGTLVIDLTKITPPTLTLAPTKGTATINPDGSVKYTPNVATSGIDTFIYSICDKTNTSVCDTALVILTIIAAPQAIPDNAVAIVGISVTIPILSNDKNPDGTSVTDLTKITTPIVSLVPTKGTATVNANGSIKYTANLGASGTDTFIYTICSSTNPIICDTALVTIKLNQKPIATPDIAVTPANQPVTGNVLTNDFDLDHNTLVVSTTPITAPTKGSLTLNANGTFTYTPNAGASGNDTFCYKICDNGVPSACDTACVNIQIVPSPVLANNAPVANDDDTQTTVGIPIIINAKANDIDPDGFATLGTPTQLSNPTHGLVIQLPNGNFTYTPTIGFIGTDFFTYSICDTGTPSKCDTATITVEILPTQTGNHAPVALNDVVATVSGVPVIIPVKNNDSDPDLNNLGSPAIITQPAAGTVTVNGNGTLTFTPSNATFVGTATFKYAICDDGIPNKCDTASVSVVVLAPNKVCLTPKAYLQGALLGVDLPNTLMRDDLRAKNLIPTTSPYLGGLTTANTTTSLVLATTGANAIVDWVFVELRSGTDSTLIVDSRSALIQRDGDIVDVDGTGSVIFSLANTGQYYLVVKHRNHLGVMSAKNAMSNICKVIDFQMVATHNFNKDSLNIINQPQVIVQQGKAMWAGNALEDNNIIYQGSANDVIAIYLQVINATGNLFVSPSYKLKGYYTGDIDMNGETIFQGTGNDVEFIYQNVLKNHPGNILGLNYFIIKQQLP
jgi:hypothetical protein